MVATRALRTLTIPVGPWTAFRRQNSLGFPRHVRRSLSGGATRTLHSRDRAPSPEQPRLSATLGRSLSGGATCTPSSERWRRAHSTLSRSQLVRGPRPVAGTVSHYGEGLSSTCGAIASEWWRHAHYALLRFFFHVAAMRSFSCCRHAVFLMLPPCGLSHVVGNGRARPCRPCAGRCGCLKNPHVTV